MPKTIFNAGSGWNKSITIIQFLMFYFTDVNRGQMLEAKAEAEAEAKFNRPSPRPKLKRPNRTLKIFTMKIYATYMP